MKLKNCPFCGASEVGIGFAIQEFGGDLTYFVVCDKCECKTKKSKTMADAVFAWNRRPDDD